MPMDDRAGKVRIGTVWLSVLTAVLMVGASSLGGCKSASGVEDTLSICPMPKGHGPVVWLVRFDRGVTGDGRVVLSGVVDGVVRVSDDRSPPLLQLSDVMQVQRTVRIEVVVVDGATRYRAVLDSENVLLGDYPDAEGAWSNAMAFFLNIVEGSLNAMIRGSIDDSAWRRLEESFYERQWHRS